MLVNQVSPIFLLREVTEALKVTSDTVGKTLLHFRDHLCRHNGDDTPEVTNEFERAEVPTILHFLSKRIFVISNILREMNGSSTKVVVPKSILVRVKYKCSQQVPVETLQSDVSSWGSETV